MTGKEWRVYRRWITGNPAMVRHYMIDQLGAALAPDDPVAFTVERKPRRITAKCAGHKLVFTDR